MRRTTPTGGFYIRITDFEARILQSLDIVNLRTQSKIYSKPLQPDIFIPKRKPQQVSDDVLQKLLGENVETRSLIAQFDTAVSKRPEDAEYLELVAVKHRNGTITYGFVVLMPKNND